MSDQVRQIAQRVKELREISDLTVAEVASKVELSPEEYEAYESGPRRYVDQPAHQVERAVRRGHHHAVDRAGPAPERVRPDPPQHGHDGPSVPNTTSTRISPITSTTARSSRCWSPWSPAPTPIWRPTATTAMNLTTCSRVRCASRSGTRTWSSTRAIPPITTRSIPTPCRHMGQDVRVPCDGDPVGRIRRKR